jgi:hypothetical protein
MEAGKIGGQCSRLGCRFLILVLLLALTASASAQIIPSSRRVTWQGNVGVSGGIPARTTICTTLGVAGQSSTYAQSVTAGQITSALSSCPSGQTVYLNPGTYTITQSIVPTSGRTLRGSGPSQTILKANAATSGGGYPQYRAIWNIVNSFGSPISVSSGYTAGSSQIVLSDASSISVGDVLRIDELNDAPFPVTQVGVSGTCNSCDPYGTGGTRARAQHVKVVAKAGNTLTLEVPLVWTFSSGNSPQVIKWNVTSSAGIEDLQIWNASTTDVTSATFYGSDNCWIKNVKTVNGGQYNIYLATGNYRTEIRQVEVTGYAPTTDDTYGMILNGVSGALVENNLFHDTGSATLVDWGSSGNVIAYNYSVNVHRTTNMTNWFWADMWEHAAHTGHNLYEGNMITSFSFDVEWGSHSNNTVFRNQATAKSADISYLSTVQGTRAIAILTYSHNFNVVGNVFGTSGWNNHYERSAESFKAEGEKNIYLLGLWQIGSGSNTESVCRSTLLRHANYDYYNNSIKYCDDSGEPGCQGGDASHTLPNSLYLSAKPSWWCNESTWPPVNPVGPTVSDIPAKRRYNGETCTLPAPNAPTNLRIVP